MELALTRGRRSVHTRIRLLTWGIAAAFFFSIAPTLRWPEFSGDSEDLLVQTTLEMRNGGPWWVPTLGGVPRTRKPPLPAWISAAAVSPEAVHQLSDSDTGVRDRAYRQLAWEVRWPALLAGALMLLATARLAGAIGGPAHIIPAMLIGGTTLLMLRYVRIATTDIYLALFVTVANACLADAVLRRRRFAGCLGGGAALGLAILCKGPVALIQSVVPLVVFAAIKPKIFLPSRIDALELPSGDRVERSARPSWWGPIFSGCAMILAIALPWFVITLIRQPNSLAIWLGEMRRKGRANIAHDPWYAYVSFVPNLLPWIPIYIGGVLIAGLSLLKRRRIGLAFLLVFIPILVMSFFPDRKERYLLPLAGPAAILAAHAAVRLKRAWPFRKIDAHVAWWTQWLILASFAIGLPILGALRLERAATALPRGHWYSMRLAMIAALCGAFLVGVGLILQRRHRQSFIVTGAVVTLAYYILLMRGWSVSDEGMSEMKPIADRIRAEIPAGRVVYYDPTPEDKPVTLDLDIYLNRSVPVLTVAPDITSRTYAGVTAVVTLREARDPVPTFAGWPIAFDLTSRAHHWYVLTPAVK